MLRRARASVAELVGTRGSLRSILRGVPRRALIIDLDNTLVPEMPNYEQAFDEGCSAIAAEFGVEVGTLRRSVFDASHALWRSSPWSAECLRLGIGSPTSLLTDLDGDRKELAELRAWMPEYRRTVWARGLAACGIDGSARDEAGVRLDAAFRTRQRGFCPSYPDAPAAIEWAASHYRLALATNGPGDVQRAKLRAAGLERYFPVVLVSAEIGSGKPERAMFDLALAQLGIGADDAVVVGDSRERDIAGARNAGIASILLDRGVPPSHGTPSADVTIATLSDLPSALTSLNR